MTDNPNGLGRAIAAARSERGWKRKDLALAAGISYPFLAEVENGNKRPSVGKLEDIASALELTSPQLLEKARLLELGAGAQPEMSHAAHSLQASLAAPEDFVVRVAETESEIDEITRSVLRALEPRVRELVELELRRAQARDRGAAW